MTLELPEEKITGMQKSLKRIQVKNKCQITEFASFVGHIEAYCPSVNYGWLHLKLLEQERYLTLCKSKGNYDAQMLLKSFLQIEFDWWSKNSRQYAYKNPHYQLETFSVASTTEWGAFCGTKLTSGFWSNSEKKIISITWNYYRVI